MRRSMTRAILWAVLSSLAAWVFLILMFQVGEANAAGPDVFDRYLEHPYPVAKGFDFPVGNAEAKGSYVDAKTGKRHQGWYVAAGFGERYSLGLHPGEDWNGRGGGNTDEGQPVHSLAAGRVVLAKDFAGLWGKVIIIEHLFYENHEKKRIRSLYAHLKSMTVKTAQVVTRRQTIGSIGRDAKGRYKAHLHLELRWDSSLAPTYWPSGHGKSLAWIRARYAAPSAFIRAHRKLFVPQAEAHLVLVDHNSLRMAVFNKGKRKATYEVAFGQSTGRKRRRGDLRTPKGMYFVIHRYKGEFSGNFGDYFSGHWVKINYPNPYDGDYGLARKWITKSQRKQIAKAWALRKATLGKTVLGGGIGFHGWIDEWKNDGPRGLSWGCVVAHLRDVAKIYGELPLGTMVILF
ncbi:MAG: peptidoglycan DD-metalloendopeptidase family protein [Deltaproteobacteria bacterium]|nr:peptidoglycan DD-metalloendopeptidase family protein [Deltaproteobacteria bacterium]